MAQPKPVPKNLVWLASYPKSGNTWTRIFLANYLFDRKEPMPINQVHRLGMGDSIAKAYAMVAGRAIDTSDHQAMLALRPRVLRGIAGNGADLNFVKTHNLRDFAMGSELIPAPLSRSAVYILRNPLDMVLSYARHYDMTPADAAAAIGRADNTTQGDATSVPQYLGNWSRHVTSWTERAPFPVLTVRYEDLQADPQGEFIKVLKHIGFPVDQERLERAVRFSAFEEVSRQEADKGFIEKSPTAERFFTKGTSGQWESDLAPELVEAIRTAHGSVMKRHGYL